MAASGTYSFNPSLGSLGAYALGKSGIRRPEITASHLADVAMAANLVLAEWATSQPNLWTVALASVALTQGTVSYTLPSNVILVTDCYLTITQNGVSTDRVIFPISRTEYLSYPNKTFQSTPTVFWFDRVIPPTLTLYPAPDALATYVLNYYAARQDQDAVVAGATGLDIPYRFFRAFADCLAAELATTYAPDRAVALDAAAQRSRDRALASDQEMVPLYIGPVLGSYYR